MNKTLINTVCTAFEEQYGYAPEFVIRAPGRINIIGEHTDYNQGFVLPGAIDKALYFAVGTQGEKELRFKALDIDQEASAAYDTITASGQLWLDYLLGIAQQFQLLGHNLQALDIAFGGDLPIGAGVSSSAALECGMAMIWNRVLGAQLDRKALALLAQRSSQQFLGIPCGIMDQFASLHGRKEQVILLDCRDLSFQYQSSAVADCEWVMLNTQVSHQLADSEYPLRVQECKEGLAALQAKYPSINAFRDASVEQLETVKTQMSAKAYMRSLYVIQEHERTLAMLRALEQGDAPSVGALLNATHLGLSELYEVSCPEIECLFDFSKKHPAVYGSRLMGGGFGGCTINLVQSAHKNAFITAALAHYEQQMGKKATAFDVCLSDGVGEVEI